ncbi:MAG: 1-acyl-sn-glycerol-3-phosphate acyltransferase [Bacteroidales bacterium]|nr:1-acyl-sn-glycerol-3-phosphate acyltransferase [Bacteroidales bacterium]
MRKIWEFDPVYKFARHYVDFTTRTCFRSVTIEGKENLPTDGVVILAPNHCAAMMDPMLVLVTEKGPVAFGARSDIFAQPAVAKILRWLRIVPIARERNGLHEVAKNFEVFDEIVECLDHQVPFCLYSEGTHRAERGMLPVKKGIFRIARMALDKLGKKVYVAPMGIDYEYFFRGQGRVALRFGQPIDIGAYFQEHSDEVEAAIYRGLCRELQTRDLALIGCLDERRHDRKLLRALGAMISLPLFALCAAGSLLIWLPHLIILSQMEDKAWSHTVRFVLHFLFPVLWPFHIPFERLLNFYRNLIEDCK